MKNVKICILGCGNFANYAHGPNYAIIAQNQPGVEYVAAADMELEKAQKFAAKFGIPRAYGDWREMAAKEKPDGICVLTGVAATSRTASEVLLEGIPVMMEKPPGRNREEILAIIEASRKTNTPAMVAFNRRYSPLLTQMLAIREKECQEPIEYVRCDFTRHERMDLDFSTTSIHGIDAIRHLSGGAYTEATFRYQQLNREKPAWNIYVDAQFDNGVYGQITFQPCSGSMFERYMISTRHWTLIAHAVCPGGGSDVPGWIEVFHKGMHVRNEAPTPNILNKMDIFLSGYYGENAAFADRLQNGFPAFSDLEMSLDAVELADCIRNKRDSWKKNQ